MTIANAQYYPMRNNKCDIFTEELRRKDQLIVPIDVHGKPDYYHHPAFRYMLELNAERNIDFLTVSSDELGEVHKIDDEDNYLVWHGINVFSLINGFHPDEDEFYQAMLQAFDKIFEEQEDEFVRPFRIVDPTGSLGWHNPHETTSWAYDGWENAWRAAMADTQLELATYRLEF